MTRDWKELRHRLQLIAEIIEGVDERCMWHESPMTPTLQEMTQAEISTIYAIAKGEKVTVKTLPTRD